MLPKRQTTYILTLLLLLLVVVVGWVSRTLNSPELQKAVARKKTTAPPRDTSTAQLSAGSVQTRPALSQAIDPQHQQMADELHSEETTPQRDLEIIQEFLTLYDRALKGGLPIGDNSDITAALTGSQYPGQKGRVFPQTHRTIRNGQLIDRWGEPLWFHPNSGNSMEIRSAGPDRQLFTADDIILNPSPGGYGATPPGTPEMPQ